MVISSTCDTAAILASASPLKPRDETAIRSSIDLILLVACLLNAISISSLLIPLPLSVTLINEIPPSFISTVIAVAPASIAFSTSSLTTEEGLSTTSPAAILLIVFWSKSVIDIQSSLFCETKCDCPCRSRGFSLLVLPAVLSFSLQLIKRIQCINRCHIAYIKIHYISYYIIILNSIKKRHLLNFKVINLSVLVIHLVKFL